MARTKQSAPQRLPIDVQEQSQPVSRKRSASYAAKEDAELKRRGDAGEDRALVVRHKSKSTLPAWARFPLVLLMNLCLSSVLYSVSAQWTAGELASVSKRYKGWTVLAGLLTWRGVELGLGWFGDHDSYDLVSLAILQSFPPVYLLYKFYNVSTTTALTSLLIDALAIYVPLRLLRPISPAHKTSSIGSGCEERVPNQAIVTDYSIQIITTILAAAIYSTTVYASCATFLPTTLVTYFNDIPTVAPAHTSTPISMLPMALILGLAARSFIFTPAIALPNQEPIAFDPVTASLSETIRYNVWGWSAKTKMVTQRTAVLGSVVGVNGFLQVWATVAGVEPTGAAIYSGVWVAAQLFTGVAFGLVVDV